MLQRCTWRGGIMAVAAFAAVAASPQGPDSPAKRALFDADTKAKNAPLEEAVGLFQQVVDQYSGTEWAGLALTNISSLYLRAKQPDKALEFIDRCLNEYRGGAMPGWAVRHKFVVLAQGLSQPQQALEFLDAALPQYQARFSAQDRLWVPMHRYDALWQLGRKDAAVLALDEALPTCPQLLNSDEFFKRYVPGLRLAGRAEEALSAAKGAWACCAFSEDGIRKAADLVTTELIATGALTKADAFLEAQRDSTKPNPLAEIAWPQIADEPGKQLMASCGTDSALQVCVLLYYGAYDDALQVATVRLAEVQDPKATVAALDGVARCFKAKDLNLTRGNAFLRYAKEGEGDNPLLSF